MSTITSITGLQNLTNLQQFLADWNSLSTVNVSGLTNLVTLDVSDCEIPGTEGERSLTSVNVSGCTALEELRLDDSNFSAGIPNLTGLNALTYLDLDQCGLSGEIDLTILPSLTGFDLSSNTGITYVVIPESPINNVNLGNTALTEYAVNNMLQWLDGSQVANGTVDLGGGTSAIPTGNGITAVTNLQGKGWQVYVNEITTTTTTAAPQEYTLTGTIGTTPYDACNAGTPSTAYAYNSVGNLYYGMELWANIERTVYLADGDYSFQGNYLHVTSGVVDVLDGCVNQTTTTTTTV